MSRMWAVAVHPSAEMYGSDRMFLESAAALNEPRIAVLPHDGPLAAALAEVGVRVEIMDFPILRRVELRTPMALARFVVRFLCAVPKLALWIRRVNPQVVYVSTVIAPVWIYAARLAFVDVACHVHESEPGMSSRSSKVLLWPLRGAHRVIVNSLDSQRWVAGATSRKVAARTTVVYNGVSDPLPAEPVVWRARSTHQLVVVGRLSERKGQDVAVRATKLLRDRGHDVSLTLVGDCFPGYEHVVDDLEMLVDSLDLTPFVSFEGFQPDPCPYMRGAAVVLVPSRVEPFGLVAVEALMLARPTVVSGVGGLVEIVTDGVTGRVVPPDDPAALSDAVADLLEHPETATTLAAAGRLDAARRFSMDRYHEDIRAAIRAT